MTKNLESALQESENPVDFVRTLGPEANTDHLRLFQDLPSEVTNWREEQNAWAHSVAIADLSHHMTDLRVEGPDALQLFMDVGANDFSGFAPGKAKQFVACNEDGYLIGDGILFYLDENEFNLVGYGPINWVQYHIETGEYDVVTTRNDHCGIREGDPEDFRFQVQGPDALELIKEVVDGSLPDIPFFNFDDVSIAGHRINALRHGMMSEPGFEFFGPWDVQADVRTAVVEAGQKYDIRQIGAKAYPSNVIAAAWMSVPLPAIYHDGMEDYREWLGVDSFEGAITIAGSLDSDDITDYYLTPFGAGHDQFLDFDHDYIGKEALQKQADNPKRTKRTLVWDETDAQNLFDSLFSFESTYKYTELPVVDTALTQLDKVLVDGEQVGIANNTRYLSWERNMFSLGAINVEHADPGTEVSILWGEPGGTSSNPRVSDHEQHEIRAEVAPAPYFEDKRKTADYSVLNR